MTANPPIRALTDIPASPSFLIKRYLSSISGQQGHQLLTGRPTEDDDQPRPSIYDNRAEPIIDGSRPQVKPQGQGAARSRKGEEIPYRKFGVKARLEREDLNTQGQIPPQLQQVHRDLSQFQASCRPERQSAPLPKRGSSSKRPRDDGTGEKENERASDTESAQRRSARKQRRREKAAIINPKPSPLPVPSSKRKTTRKRPTKPVQPDPEPERRTQLTLSPGEASELTSRPKVRSRIPGWDIIKKYQPAKGNVFSDRLTMGKQVGMFSLAKTSNPVHLPSGKPVRSTQRVQAHLTSHGAEPQKPSYARPMHGAANRRRGEDPNIGSDLMDIQPSDPRQIHSGFHQYRFQPRTQPQPSSSPHTRLSNGRLPPPGVTNSPSWPTGSSSRLPSSGAQAYRVERPRRTGSEIDAAEQEARYAEESREVDDIMGRGGWRWPEGHPVRRALIEGREKRKVWEERAGVSDAPAVNHLPEHQYQRPLASEDGPSHGYQRLSSSHHDSHFFDADHFQIRLFELDDNSFPPHSLRYAQSYNSPHQPLPPIRPYAYLQPDQARQPSPRRLPSSVSHLRHSESPANDLTHDQPFFDPLQLQPAKCTTAVGASSIGQISSRGRWENEDFGAAVHVDKSGHVQRSEMSREGQYDIHNRRDFLQREWVNSQHASSDQHISISERVCPGEAVRQSERGVDKYVQPYSMEMEMRTPSVCHGHVGSQWRMAASEDEFWRSS